MLLILATIVNPQIMPILLRLYICANIVNIVHIAHIVDIADIANIVDVANIEIFKLLWILWYRICCGAAMESW